MTANIQNRRKNINYEGHLVIEGSSKANPIEEYFSKALKSNICGFLGSSFEGPLRNDY